MLTSIKEILLGGDELPIKLDCECEKLRFLEYSFQSKLYKCVNCGDVHEIKIKIKNK